MNFDSSPKEPAQEEVCSPVCKICKRIIWSYPQVVNAMIGEMTFGAAGNSPSGIRELITLCPTCYVADELGKKLEMGTLMLDVSRRWIINGVRGVKQCHG